MYSEKVVGQFVKPLVKTTVLLFAALFTFVLGPNVFETQGQAFAEKNWCKKTVRAATLACQREATADYWIAVGNCNNLSDLEDRRECYREAKWELKEAQSFCRSQTKARLDVCGELGPEPYDPQIDDIEFVDPTTAATNPYFPLVPGTVWVYEGGGETITVTVTDDVKEIMGVPCIVVYDFVEEDGEVIEDTEDWYAQDIDGNVWYFGEISQNFEDGELTDLEGSWKAGVDGAKPGIIMSADPQVGELYRQEFFLGEAEDVAKVVNIDTETVTVPYGTFTDTLKTKDYTPIEPDVTEFKYYAPGVGVVMEINPDTGERVELVSKSNPYHVFNRRSRFQT